VTDNPDDSFNASKAEIFEALGHPTRIRILQELSEKPLAFSELKRSTGLESNGLLTFHLGRLKDLVKLNPEGAYAVTDEGREALRLIQTVHATEVGHETIFSIELKKDSLPVFVIGMMLTLAVFIPISYFLSFPLVDIVIASAFVIFFWLNGFRLARRKRISPIPQSVMT
jgi:DNA-binding transcriptional ArsR family regulator